MFGIRERTAVTLRAMESRPRMQSGFSTAPRLRRSMTAWITARFESTRSSIVNDLEITVIYTNVSETERRIISAWRAEQHEREAYWQSIV